MNGRIIYSISNKYYKVKKKTFDLLNKFCSNKNHGF